MRPIPPGYETHHEVLVTEAMTVDFEDRVDLAWQVALVYATY